MKRKIFNRNERGLFSGIITAFICAVLVSSQVLMLGVNSTNGQSKSNDDRKINEIIKLGKEFQTLMKAVNSLSNKSLDSEEEVTEAVNTLDRYKETLTKGGYASLFLLATNDSAFIKSVEAKANELGEEQFLAMLKSDPKMVLKFTNAKKIQSNMKTQINQYVKDFKTLGTKLKNAGEKYKTQTNGGFNRLDLGNSSNDYFQTSKVSYNRTPQISKNSAVVENSYHLFSKDQVTFTNSVTINRRIDFTVMRNTVLVLVTQTIPDIFEDFEPAPDGGPSDNEICLGESLGKLTACLARANERKGLNKIFGRANCWAVFLIDNHLCILLPQ